MLCTFGQLKDKEVINVCDGHRLGYVCDAEIDTCIGRICALIIPGPSKCLGFVRGNTVRVPWECVERIGDDIILVNAGKLLFHDKHPSKEKGSP